MGLLYIIECKSLTKFFSLKNFNYWRKKLYLRYDRAPWSGSEKRLLSISKIKVKKVFIKIHHENFLSTTTKVAVFVTIDMVGFHNFSASEFQDFNLDMTRFLYPDLRVKCHDWVKLSYKDFYKKRNHKIFPNALSKMDLFVTIVVCNRKSLTIFTKSRSLDPALKSVFMNKQNTSKTLLRKLHY